MAYEPLHHKYRPQRFAQLVGQDAIASTLSNALEQQRIPPAYLFCGPRGTGKTSSARILAKSLNCLQGSVPTPTPCGECESCRAIVNGSALDVIEIDAASNTGVDNIRELIERAQFAPVQCRFKVYVIDECHMLSTAAFNALLKTLEEPPDRVVFILATTDPQRVLPTIISRCQRFDFRRIPLEAMVSHLQAIAQAEAIEITDEAVRLVAQVSQGGLRDAQSLLDQLSLLSGAVTIERVWDLVGAVPERDLFALVQAIAADDGVAVLDQARYLMDRGREPLIVLQNLASFYRDLMIAKTSPDRGDLVTITPSTWPQLCEFVQAIALTQLLAGQQHLRSAEVQVKNTTQPRLWLEVTLLGLLPSASPQPSGAQPGGASLPQAAKAWSNAAARPAPAPPAPLPSPAASAPAPAAAPAPPPAVVEPAAAIASAPPPAAADSDRAVDSAPTPARDRPPSPPPPDPVPSAPPPSRPQVDVTQVWQQVLSQIQPPATQALLNQHCRLLDFDGTEAQVTVSSQPLFKLAKSRLPNIEAAFQQVFQQPIRISLIVAAPSEPGGSVPTRPAPPPVTPAPPRPAEPARSPAPPPLPAVVLSDGPPELAPVLPEPIADPLPMPDLTIPPPTRGGEDEVSRASHSFAQFFNGQVVELDDDLWLVQEQGSEYAPEHPRADRPDATAAAPPPAIAEFKSDFDAEDDVPF